jgi:hypothetical protein
MLLVVAEPDSYRKMKGARKVFREWPANYWPNNSLLLRIY